MSQVLPVYPLVLDTVAPVESPTPVNADTTLIIPATADGNRLFMFLANRDASTPAEVSVLPGVNPPAFQTPDTPLAFTLEGTGGDFPAVTLAPFTTARYTQADGTIHLAVALGGGDGIDVTVYQFPRESY